MIYIIVNSNDCIFGRASKKHNTEIMRNNYKHFLVFLKVCIYFYFFNLQF
jgi:hypothetical protein